MVNVTLFSDIIVNISNFNKDFMLKSCGLDLSAQHTCLAPAIRDIRQAQPQAFKQSTFKNKALLRKEK
jgi:hypothetical protein